MKKFEHELIKDPAIALNSKDAIFIADTKGTLLDCNKAAEKMIGKKCSQIFEKNIEILHPKKISQEVRKSFAGMVKSNGAKTCEMEVISASGKIIDVQISVTIMKKNGKKIVVGYFSDISELKQAKETAERYLDIAGVMIVALDSNGKVVTINKRGCEILGYRKNEIMGKDWFYNFLPKGHIKEVKGVFNKIIKGALELTEFYKNPVLRKDGTQRIIAWHNSVVKNDAGKIIGILSSGEDVTELSESEERLRVTTENIEDAIFAKDANKKYTFVNPAAAKMMGLSADKIIGKTAKEIFSKKDAEIINKVDNANLKGKKIDQTEKLTIGKNERFLHTTQNPIQGSNGEIVGIVGAVKDVTDQKKSEELLKESEEKYRLISDHSADWETYRDANGKLLYSNISFEKITGFKLKDYESGKVKLEHLFPKTSLPAAKSLFEKAKKGLVVNDVVLEAVKKDGSTAWISISVRPVKINGVMKGFRTSIRDVTERKNIEVALRDSEQRHRLLYETSSDAVMTLEPPSWNFTSGNSAIINMFGVKSEEQFTSLPPWKLSPKYQPDGQLSSVKAKKMIETAMKKGEHFFEWTHKKLEGEDFYATVLLNRVETEKKSFLQARVSDITEKKLAENKILDVKERFEDISKASGDFIWEVDAQGKYTHASGKVKSILGYTPKELVGKTPFDIMTPDEAVRVGKLFAQIIKNKKPIKDLENWNFKKTGEKICLLTNGSPILDDNDELIGYRGVDKDITKDKIREEAIQRESKDFQLLSQIGIDLNSPAEFGENINKALEKLATHFALDRIAGFDIVEKNAKISPHIAWVRKKDYHIEGAEIDLTSVPSFMKTLQDDGIILADNIKDLSPDLYIFFKKKKIKSVLTLPIKPFGETGSFICFHAIENYKNWQSDDIRIIKIITNMLSQSIKRQASHTETIEEKNKLEKTLFNIGDAVIAIDKDLKVTNFNKVASEISGIRPEDILGKRYDSKLKFVHAENKEKIDQFILDVFATGEEQRMQDQTVLINTKGESIPIADSATPLMDPQGNVIGAVLVFRDVTLEQEINKMKTEFVTVASHQLRTPLSGIKWITELLLTEKSGKLNAKQVEMINNITISNKRMITLVSDLLNVSRMEEGKKLIIKRKHTDICKIIKLVIDENAILAKSKNISVQISKNCETSEGVALNIDEERIKESIHNVINNAIKYSKKNGKVVIDIKQTPKSVSISVKDNGVGIPPRQQNKVFQKFFRANNVLTLQTDGTGLGLYICKLIIEAHKGKIWFESELNKGTTFHITLPKKKPLKK